MKYNRLSLNSIEYKKWLKYSKDETSEFVHIWSHIKTWLHVDICLDEEYKNKLDQESEQIGKSRIEESFDKNDWMSPDEFGKHLKDEIKRIYNEE